MFIAKSNASMYMQLKSIAVKARQWGGILLGFLVGTNGQLFLDAITKLSSQGGTSIGANISNH